LRSKFKGESKASWVIAVTRMGVLVDMKASIFRASWVRVLAVAVLGCGMAGSAAVGQTQSAAPQQPLVKLGPIPAAAQFDSSGHLNVEAATRAYLDTIPADKREASNKYFEGGYWLLLWNCLLTVVIMLGLLFSGASRRMRDLATRITRFKWLQAWIYFVQFVVILTVVRFPWNVYVGFYREHIYGQSQQAFSGWLRDQAVGAMVGLVLGGIVVATLYAVVRRFPKSWYVWCSVLVVVFQVIGLMIAPVYIAPLFNTYTPLNYPEVTVPVLKMAHANGINVDKLVEVDASKQTTQVSANVSGIFGTTQIRLNDNLLHQASLEEIEDVAGHEMGHYVMNHLAKFLCEVTILIFILFALLRLWAEGMQRRWGVRWGTDGIADPALFPAVVLAATVILLLMSPITNTMIRTQEYEADMFGLNAARQPDGSAQIDLKLGQYRKLEPGPVEEFLFFDHPSGYVRIRAAMQWKSENAHSMGGY
jgi:STE24 endopeptidase